ncbi:hypothetical protein L5M36_02920 [Shewanella sp. SM72]|uniref:hypothetical protein n=1 Tax=Shewanella TaxID=22 RepID=UPI0021DA6CB9|nr:hypothetical protein [Shewanella sp. SM72]MCU8015849.1 hypothetical protein [Shewanella sp. SM72]
MPKKVTRSEVEFSLLDQLYKVYLTNKFDVYKKYDLGEGPLLDLSTLIKDLGLEPNDFSIGSNLYLILVDMHCEFLIEDLSPTFGFGLTINNHGDEIRNIMRNEIQATGIIKNLKQKLDLN